MVQNDLLGKVVVTFSTFVLSCYSDSNAVDIKSLHRTIASVYSKALLHLFGLCLTSSPSPFCAFSSRADILNGSWGGQQIPFKTAASVTGEFRSISALKTIWEIN